MTFAMFSNEVFLDPIPVSPPAISDCRLDEDGGNKDRRLEVTDG